jgi:hypothetical protein
VGDELHADDLVGGLASLVGGVGELDAAALAAAAGVDLGLDGDGGAEVGSDGGGLVGGDSWTFMGYLTTGVGGTVSWALWACDRVQSSGGQTVCLG